LSKEKQEEIARKKQKNNENGQLNNMSQQAAQPPNFGGMLGAAFGQQQVGNVFANLVQPHPAPINPYQVFNAFHHPVQVQPHHGPQHSQHNPMGAMMGMPQQHHPQPQANPFLNFIAQPAPPPMMMAGMGGAMNPYANGFINPMAQMGMMGGVHGGAYRGW
jgi:hypothetical protein